MPLITSRPERTVCVRHITQLYVENREVLYAYATMSEVSTAYVLNALIDLLKKEAKFKKWRAEHPESCVPDSERIKRGIRPKSRRSNAAQRAGLASLSAV